jgi:hypothetical protein
LDELTMRTFGIAAMRCTSTIEIVGFESMTPVQRSRKFSPAQRRTFAYHEAGHAVAIHVLGYAFVAVEIYDRPVDKEAGAVVRDTLQDEILLIHDMVISYAGPLAQCRRLKRGKLNAIVVREGSHDFNHADKCADQLASLYPGIEGFEFVGQAMALAKELVKRRWSDIEIVAEALITGGRLSYDEFCALLA